ncbi:LptF/LptG family permease [Helicobacter mustelae]|uniref:Putative integral membrane protein n=1 Tax=Helicobacter mustelae (strain ATCC 43772 / CCUG 25715 / CIP 103759 / LMG 18044 / NCTC 12198 / R85-136P) TaxID=679897 RepID=D3UHU0_HELM1|nr:LptF/LptG family permease [Helicobacter mustelae]CBG40063.1 putative integral membrane protein [Helicobacter mustelae 12198]SQH71577.1 permease YjgP/YjgQ [Helicobacter mustelae]STP12702.1 permease YjgP/YjgQ [Helicobacter mustelae]
MFFYLGRQFFRFILIVFSALEIFFISIDSLKYLDQFPSSANLIVLFFAYDFLYALNYTLPISILLATIIFYLNLVKSNQYTAFLALGYTRKQILAPVFFISLTFTFLYVGLNATPFVYAQERAEAIMSQENFTNITEDLLVKYENNYVYFQKLYPLIKRAENIKVFELDKQGRLQSFAQAKDAIFLHNYWVLSHASISKVPEETTLGKAGLEVSEVDKLKILKGFRPKILDTIYQNKPSVSIIDAIQSLIILQNQDSNSEKIRAILYAFILIPFFVPLTSIIIGFYAPTLSRYSNLALLGFMFIVLALVIWGLFFAFGKLSISGLLPPEIMMLIPFGLLCVLSLFYFKKINQKI